MRGFKPVALIKKLYARAKRFFIVPDKDEADTMHEGDERNKWSDERLFRAAESGDEIAFIIISRRFTYLFRFLSALCQRDRVPESVATTLALQTIRVAVVESIGNPIPAEGDRWNWLQEIALREFQDWVANNRQVLPKPPITLNARSSQPSQAFLKGTPPTDCVGKYLKWLSDDHRDLIEMVMLKGMTVEAAGKTIGWDAIRSVHEFMKAHRTISDLIKEHGCD